MREIRPLAEFLCEEMQVQVYRQLLSSDTEHKVVCTMGMPCVYVSPLGSVSVIVLVTSGLRNQMCCCFYLGTFAATCVKPAYLALLLVQSGSRVPI